MFVVRGTFCEQGDGFGDLREGSGPRTSFSMEFQGICKALWRPLGTLGMHCRAIGDQWGRIGTLCGDRFCFVVVCWFIFCDVFERVGGWRTPWKLLRKKHNNINNEN